ncbi:MAG: hypothetical protein V1834_02260 [Candidatus Micrarchaeota archaeon]
MAGKKISKGKSVKQKAKPVKRKTIKRVTVKPKAVEKQKRESTIEAVAKRIGASRPRVEKPVEQKKVEFQEPVIEKETALPKPVLESLKQKKGDKITTGIDDLMSLVNAKGEVAGEDAARLFKVPLSEIEEWGKCLEDHKLAEMSYSLFGSLKIRGIKK